jgi:hypothetical protein
MEETMKYSVEIMRPRFAATVVGALLLIAPATAEDKVPSTQFQEMLVKSALLTLNDANITGNYTVLHAKMAAPSREQLSVDRLKQAFKGFADQKIFWGAVATMPPIATSETKIDARGALILRGYFDAKPNRLIYELDFLPSEGEWKPIKLNVSVKPAT